MTPESSPKPNPAVVGIGASAGGLTALKTFLDQVPEDSGLAFVVVVHLPPDHESHLAEVLQPHVRFPVQQVNETMPLEANHVYVIPPKANLSTIDTHLRVTRLEERRQERAPIDHFFRTLASTHNGNAVAVVLTGTGSDGTLGIKDIKANGGLVIVQDPNEAEFDGMPQSVIATGLADFILPVGKIPETILKYHRTAPKVPLPAEGEEVPQSDAALLYKIFALMRTRTDRDFSRYKRSTVLRRIARRMQLNYVEDLSKYLDTLREQADEVRALADDLLITVTHFFRDPEVFARLAGEEIPRLIEKKGPLGHIRAWSVGCATGEEAYSLAMLLEEAGARIEHAPLIQVFASDLHRPSLERAREGFYPGDIEAEVTPERLNRFFLKESGGYRVRKELRDLVVFAPHNVLSDPPFSRIDLISCRNLLIYLDHDVQRDVIDLFHYALNAEGNLMLGSAETLDASDLFTTVDKKLCIYRKRDVPPREPRLPVFPVARRTPIGTAIYQAESAGRPVIHGPLHQQLVEQYAPPSILIDARNRIVHLSEHAGRYLVHPGGEPTENVLKLAREELRIDLQAILQEVRERKKPFDSKPIPVQFNGHARPVVLNVRPALDPELDGFVLIIFDEREPQTSEEDSQAQGSPAPAAARVKELENELSVTRQRLQGIIEEYESSQEEMKASSEEMQSTNEELRSTLEELETSREELQSANEELQTVNQQNRHKVEELGQLSGDLQNLLAATDIATLFLDRDLRIQRFTPKLSDLFNVLTTDRGRPISDLTHRLGYDRFRQDAETVLARLVPIEREVQDEAGAWYLTRIAPYRTTDDRIGGVVITFVDIDSRKRAVEALQANQERLRRMVDVDVVGVLIFDEAGTLIDCNEAYLKMSGYTREEVTGKRLTRLNMTPPEYTEATRKELVKLGETGRIGPYEKEHVRKDGSRRWMFFVGASLADRTIVEYCIDVSARKRAEELALEAQSYAASIVDTLLEPLVVLTADLRLRSVNPAFHGYFELKPEDTAGRRIFDICGGQWDTPALHHVLEEQLSKKGIAEDVEVEFPLDGNRRRVMLLNARRLDHLRIILLGLRDITERKRAEEELRGAEHNLRLTNEALLRVNTDLKHFSYAVSHDMQEPLRMVMSYTQLLARHFQGSLDDRAAQYMQFAIQGAKRMENLLDGLREYWSVDEDRADESVLIDCNAVLDRALGHLQAAIEESKALVTRDHLPTVRTEIYPLTLLFQNLVSNGIKYRKPDTEPRIHVSAERNGSGWTFVVADNGLGIEPEYQQIIFAPFKRLHGRDYPGTGLGLAMCKRIVERYHGRIWVESEPGNGSKFKFTFPALEDAA